MTPEQRKAVFAAIKANNKIKSSTVFEKDFRNRNEAQVKINELPLMSSHDIHKIKDPNMRKALFARREGLSMDDPLISERGFNA